MLIGCCVMSAIVGCGSPSASCVAGESHACEGSGCSGHQVCAADGQSYGSCLCDTANGVFPSTGPNSGLIGAACRSNSDCRLGLECIGSSGSLASGQGPSAGMCLARCLPDHDFCKGLDALSTCIVVDNGGTPGVTTDDLAYCMPGCTLGTQATELDKCRGRSDLACTEKQAGSSSGYCRPACRSDLDCRPRFCDLSTGLCGDSASTGDGIGASCTESAATSTCSGGCIALQAGYSECSGVCRYATPGCGQVNTDTQLDYYCLHKSADIVGDGDLGYCARLCDCDADCQRSDAVCEPKSELLALAGRKGVCGSKLLSSGALRKNIPCQ